ncbi:hypothetical protein LCGC14_0253980 [marine sediment metagenome]|uniref:hydroxymethylbilane synthase n=1 Tax=marine sediment metagenome TaxID=412755 RepID=A0A0F9UKJ6_9ZZZZ|nr:hydroxymethylbilane synthase [Phycisphaerae bacterium]HDZ44689.1 hydroxymethylbilane synthase [Phycisphaerae bacterium]
MSGIVIGTRGSPLAMWQANHIRDAIVRRCPDQSVELKVIKTSGDQALLGPGRAALDKGMFTTEIENELLAGTISLAVHSLKDLPTDIPEGLSVTAITVREDPADAIIAKSALPLADLPAGAIVLTGSLRRRGQLLHCRPDLSVQPVRGNVQTRLRKLDESDAEAIVLARAGLVRADLDDRITQRLDPDEFLPACGQGALALEICCDNSPVQELLAPLDDMPTRLAVTAERAFLAALGGGCQVPVGAYARFSGGPDALTLTGMVSSLDGVTLLRATVAAPVATPAAAEALGQTLCEQLRDQGCEEILASITES